MSDDQSSDGRTLRVVPAELAAAAKTIKYLLDELSSGFKSLDTDVVSLTKTWQGYQGGLFAQGYTEVKQGIADLLDAIADTTVALDAGAESYLEQQQVHAEAIEAVAFSLDLPDAT
ncbi:WXG100 family type VII secretion target [Nocardia brasiliensis]|uniref:WXG100 family type VII secretion target n=1 Tax=Nocardia brasiliensis (strain ATCC 700358 / HUJEG-1) TaxID=1133849 RepID=K0EG92_NOCB7|nr:WXG100 family type VII secretion target [Nocardia brasiliensis]AFT98222.1 hypothetical protein O3I_001300 [Nocardia brasiliensis ATCC 700358]OCF90885.1 hypothetical protein AW168_08595 [Nocardia brasiliensis]